MIEILLETASPLAAAGIAWDISGAVALAKGLILDDGTILRRSGSYWGSSPPAIRGLCEQRIDAKFGLGQLIIGFMLQLIAAIGVQASWEVSAFVFAPIILAWCVYWFRAKWWVLTASLRFAASDTTEQVWRVHFSDVREKTWKAAVASTGTTFLPPKQ